MIAASVPAHPAQSGNPGSRESSHGIAMTAKISPRPNHSPISSRIVSPSDLNSTDRDAGKEGWIQPVWLLQ
jgi:hypothetical protein